MLKIFQKKGKKKRMEGKVKVSFSAWRPPRGSVMANAQRYSRQVSFGFLFGETKYKKKEIKVVDSSAIRRSCALTLAMKNDDHLEDEYVHYIVNVSPGAAKVIDFKRGPYLLHKYSSSV
jgi:hypothetical protein